MTTELGAPTEKDIHPLIAMAEAMTVETRADADEAGIIATRIRAKMREVEEHHDPLIKGAHKLHKDAIAAREVFGAPLKQALQLVTGKAGAWQAERRRIDAERLAKEQADQQAAQRAADEKLAEEQAQRDALAKAAEEANEPDAAAEFRKPVEAPPAEPVEEPKAEKTHVIAGMRHTTHWHAEVVDESKIPRGFLMINQPLLNSHARELKGSFDVAGCKAVETHGSATG